MATPRTEHQKDLVAEKLEAEVREAEARLRVLHAQAEARKARADMDEISGLTATKDRVKQNLADLRRTMATDFATLKRTVEQEIRELDAAIERASARFDAWDAARERRFNARLDEAEARLKVWKARADQRMAEHAMKRHDDLARLKERIELARARAADARRERYTADAQVALADAEQHFEQAYAAAAERYEKA